MQHVLERLLVGVRRKQALARERLPERDAHDEQVRA